MTQNNNSPYDFLLSQINKGLEEQEREKNAESICKEFLQATVNFNYSYRFRWGGVPLIQFPQDLIALQEIIWRIKPDLIIETGIAHGGSLIFHASMLSQIELCESISNKTSFDPFNPKRIVVGIDIDIRPQNREIIEAHPMSTRIKMLEGSSTDPQIVKDVKEIAKDYNTILVCLDSSHTHDHVKGELEAFGGLVTKGSYCIVFDTGIEDTTSSPSGPVRPWGVGNNPKTALYEYLKTHPEFEIDSSIQKRILITSAPDGYLKRIK